MPTGMGKSLVYQLPVLASGGIGIIISPLIALMEQQAEVLRQAGATVLSLGGADAGDAQKALRNFPWSGGAGFLFVSPERAETDGYLEYLLRLHRNEIALVAIDEAHCISQWGHDFRPPYKNLPGLMNRCFGRDTWPAMLCLTATLDANSQREILHDFGLKESDVVRSANMLRTNLDLRFEVYEDGNAKLTALESVLEAHRDEKIIVYAHRKKSKKQGTRALAERLVGLGHDCAPFDADLPLEQKNDTLAKFASGELKVVVATGAFGMGVDIPDVRGVIHFLLPESLEQYYQEVGRAGRDGEPAFGVLLYTPVNSKVRRDMIENARRTVDQVREVWDEVCNIGRADIKTISPWAEFHGRDDEYALFYAFERIGAIQILARGPGRLKCLEPRGPHGMALLQRLKSATRIENTAAAIRRLGLDAKATVDELFDLYHRGELSLVQSPDKTLIFRTRQITEGELETITVEINARVDGKMLRFDQFVELIETSAHPDDVLKVEFGAR
jgi:ATP-dependent DNA helicase RecQ